MTLNLKQKILGFIAGCFLISMAATILAAYYQIHAAMYKSYLADVTADTDSIAYLLSEYQIQARDYAKFLALEPGFQQAVYYATEVGSAKDATAYFESLKQEFQFTILKMSDLKGDVLLDAFGTSQEQERYAFSPSPTISIHRHETFTIEAVNPVSRKGKDIGQIVVGYALDTVFLKKLAALSQTEIALLSPAGDMAASTFADTRSFAQQVQNHADTCEFTLGGRRYLAAIRPLTEQDQPPGYLLVASDTSLLTSTIQRLGVTIGLVLLGGTGCVLALVVLLINRAVLRPLFQMVNVADALSAGRLDADVIVTNTDEIGQLQHAVQTMSAKLREVLLSIQQATGQVATGSQGISASAAQISQGAATQASSTEEVSAAMEQMAANIRQNSDNAVETERIAVKSARDAEETGRAVADAVAAMREIVQKILVIDDISRQTRMLSLNATIEAARAQEQGRGFAVVAAEVRSLAGRSQAAATEITQLAGSSMARAENAMDMLGKLVPDIQKTAELVQEITAASREQHTGTEQVNQAIQQLDQVTQQNSANAEEMAAMAETLASQAEQLQTALAFFTVEASSSQTIPAQKPSIAQAKPRDARDAEFERY